MNMRPSIFRLCRAIPDNLQMHALLVVKTPLTKVTLPLLSERTALRACKHYPSFTSALQNQYHYTRAYARTLTQSSLGRRGQDRFTRG